LQSRMKKRKKRKLMNTTDVSGTEVKKVRGALESS
jgi:hypothetical protein